METLELTKRMELAVRQLMMWDDCGGEGCDICRVAKVITEAALEIIRLRAEKEQR